jgi:hypothetical protein
MTNKEDVWMELGNREYNLDTPLKHIINEEIVKLQSKTKYEKDWR